VNTRVRVLVVLVVFVVVVIRCLLYVLLSVVGLSIFCCARVFVAAFLFFGLMCCGFRVLRCCPPLVRLSLIGIPRSLLKLVVCYSLFDS